MPDAPTPAASPTRARPAPVRAAVLRTERVAEQLVRVVLGGPGLRVVDAPVHADSYVKVVFVPPAALAGATERPDGRVDLDALRASLPADEQPRVRAYTVRSFDAATAALTIDVVVPPEGVYWRTNPAVEHEWVTTTRRGPTSDQIRRQQRLQRFAVLHTLQRRVLLAQRRRQGGGVVLT